MQKKGQVFRKCSPEFKLSVILDLRTNHLGYYETVKKYDLLGSSECGAIQTVQRWERKYLEEELGLMRNNRGRPTASGKKRGRPPKLDRQTENDLIAENQRLKEKPKAIIVSELRQNFPLKMLLNISKIARSAFYYHLSQSKKDKYAVEKEEI